MDSSLQFKKTGNAAKHHRKNVSRSKTSQQEDTLAVSTNASPSATYQEKDFKELSFYKMTSPRSPQVMPSLDFPRSETTSPVSTFGRKAVRTSRKSFDGSLLANNIRYEQVNCKKPWLPVMKSGLIRKNSHSIAYVLTLDDATPSQAEAIAERMYTIHSSQGTKVSNNLLNFDNSVEYSYDNRDFSQTRNKASIYLKYLAKLGNLNQNRSHNYEYQNESQSLNERIIRKQNDASRRRDEFLENRRNKLINKFKNAASRNLVHQQKLKLSMLHKKAKIEFKMSKTELRRAIFINLLIEKSVKNLEKAKTAALKKKSQNAIGLKPSISMSFVQDLQEGKTLSSNYSDDEANPKTPIISVKSPPSSPTSTRIDICRGDPDHSPFSPGLKKSNSTNSIHFAEINNGKHKFPTAKSFEMLLDEVPSSLPLPAPFKQPPITRKSLRELNLDSISINVQLRHDMIFDPNLEFRPNTDGEHGVIKKEKSDKFWQMVSDHIRGAANCNVMIASTLVPLLNEIKEITGELLANDDYRASLDLHMDINMAKQQIVYHEINRKHEIDSEKFLSMELLATFKFLAELLKSHCAPIRDSMIDEMISLCQGGEFTKCLRKVFDILERMKLDVANDQLRRLRPHIMERSVQFEWESFRAMVAEQKLSMKATSRWLTPFILKKDEESDKKKKLIEAFVDLIKNLGSYDLNWDKEWKRKRKALKIKVKKHVLDTSSPKKVPETFKWDTLRLRRFYNEVEDISIMGCLLVLYKQMAGARNIDSNNTEHIALLKERLWILLGDVETTVGHIVSFIAEAAGKTRKLPLSDLEKKTLCGMVEKLLSSGNVSIDRTSKSPFYEKMKDKVSAALTTYLNHRKIPENESLMKIGLEGLEKELVDLGKKMKLLIDHNSAVFGQLYDVILRRKE